MGVNRAGGGRESDWWELSAVAGAVSQGVGRLCGKLEAASQGVRRGVRESSIVAVGAGRRRGAVATAKARRRGAGDSRVGCVTRCPEGPSARPA